MWQVFAIVTLDESTSAFAAGPWTQDGVTFEARVLNWGRIDRSIPVPAGMPRVADATVRLADTDVQMRRLFTEETYRRRTVEIRLVEREASPIVQTAPLFTGEIISVKFGYGHIELTLTDKLFSWLDEEFPALITPQQFPEATSSVFAPVTQGVLVEDRGAMPLSPVTPSRWIIAQNPIDELLAVYRRRPDEDSLTLVDPSEYVTTVVPKEFYDLSFNFTFLDFASSQPDGTEVRVNLNGINERGLFGTMPGVGGSPLRNPIDFALNMTYFFLRKHGIADPSVLFATDAIGVLRERFEPGGDLEAYADGAILEPITAREFFARFLVSFELAFFQCQTGNEAGKLTFGVLTDETTALPVGEHLILSQSFDQKAGIGTTNEVLYRYRPDYAASSWMHEALYVNEAEQNLLGVTDLDASPVVRRLKADREFLELWYVRESDTAAATIARRQNFKSVASYRQSFSLPLPEVRNSMELAGTLELTHRLGIDFGGYSSRKVKTIRTAFDLDRMAVDVDTIVLTPLIPELGTPDIVRVWYDVEGTSTAVQQYRKVPAETPNGTITTFTLPSVPLTGTERIFINGLYQIPSVDYTMSAAQIVFVRAPETGDKIEAFYDVTGTGNLSRPRTIPSGTVNGVNADFTLPETPVTDSERVYVGNFMMVKGVDYTMSTPTTIHFTSSVPQAGDRIYVFYDVTGTRKARRHRQTPVGPVNGINPLFIIEESPITDTEEVFVNAMPQFPPADYSFEGSFYISTFYPSGSRGIRFTEAPRRT